MNLIVTFFRSTSLLAVFIFLSSCKDVDREGVVTYAFTPTLKEVLGKQGVVRNQITPRGIAELKKKYEGMSKKASWLYIESSGGDMVDAVALGEWIYANSLNVRVIGKGCFSSCANYVFSAGRKREIAKGAIVAWNGSALSVGYYAKLLDEAVSKTKKYYYEFCASNIRFDSEGKVNCQKDVDWNMKHATEEMIRKARADAVREKAFFDKIGVNPCIDVIGDYVEPRVKNYWYLSGKDMAKFGLNAIVDMQYEKTNVSNMNFSIELISLGKSNKIVECGL